MKVSDTLQCIEADKAAAQAAHDKTMAALKARRDKAEAAERAKEREAELIAQGEAGKRHLELTRQLVAQEELRLSATAEFESHARATVEAFQRAMFAATKVHSLGNQILGPQYSLPQEIDATSFKTRLVDRLGAVMVTEQAFRVMLSSSYSLRSGDRDWAVMEANAFEPGVRALIDAGPATP